MRFLLTLSLLICFSLHVAHTAKADKQLPTRESFEKLLRGKNAEHVKEIMGGSPIDVTVMGSGKVWRYRYRTYDPDTTKVSEEVCIGLNEEEIVDAFYYLSSP